MEEIKQIMDAEKVAEDKKAKAVEDKQSIILSAEEEGRELEKNVVKDALELKEKKLSETKVEVDNLVKKELENFENDSDALVKNARLKFNEVSEEIVGRIINHD